MVTTGIREIVADGVVTDAAVHHAADAIICGTGFQMNDVGAPFDVIGIDGANLGAQWLREGPEAYLGTSVADFLRKIDAVTLRRYVEFFHGEGTRATIGKMVPTLDFDDVDTDVLKKLDVPSLLLWGAKDRWIPTAHAAKFASRIPGAKSVMYPPMKEAPDRVMVDLRAFLGAPEKPLKKDVAGNAAVAR
ncbi:MAG: 3-oxoadipate enol-lactone hydrolase/4-carboxymuconolactone decarboxylase [uncultured Paraburkholderia sp.]|nr:MAG: 3-oxoadipate enol-lactone hydrolase/4-carboxymuconolactone decarboxylase [uncultured Paraburkholderia sp.]CAH2939760.1 MAG: 3-oxoadipate enol-lactone hydrolase/4-carboxymuconolactone decarboxylase [uncultured Paraburkholderia sp.]